MPDPFDFYNNYLQQLNDPFRQPAQRPPAKFPALAPEEEQSALSGLLGTVQSGLGYVGGALNKPGRAIRGLLSGKPEEALAAIPFSDALGITNEHNQVTGKDILGIDPTDDSWASTLGGIGAEIATDPLTYLTFGGAAVSKLGKAAKMAGVLPSGGAARAAGLAAGTPEVAALAAKAGLPEAAVAGKALGGHVGLGLPFADPIATFDLSGPLGLAGGLAGGIGKATGLSHVADALAPAGRSLKALFSPEAMGQTGEFGQNVLAPQAYKSVKSNTAQNLAELAPIMRGAAGQGHILEDILTKGNQFVGPVQPNIHEAADALRPILERYSAEERALGLPEAFRQDYFPRQITDALADVKKFGGGGGTPNPAFGLGHPGLAAREPFMADIPSMKLEQMFADQGWKTAPDVATAANYLTNTHGVGPDEAMKMADWFRSLNQTRDNLFMDPLAALQRRAMHNARVMGIGDVGLETLAKNAGKESYGSRDLRTVLNGMGLTGQDSEQAMLNALSQHAPGVVGPLEQIHVPQEVAGALEHSTRAFTVPQSLDPLVKAYDSMTNMIKGGLTAPFPAFHARNWLSQLWQNLTLGHGPTELPGLMSRARGIMADIPTEGLAKGLGWGGTDQEAARKVADLFFAHQVGSAGHMGDQIGQQAFQRLADQIPGMIPGNESALGAAGSALKKAVPTSWEQVNPLNMAGVGGKTESKFAPVAAGRGLGQDIETQGRLSGFLGLLEKGYNPDVAAAMTKAAHVDYQALTPFERNVMRRLIPFYSWARGNVPQQLKLLAERPGGLTAQAIRTGSDLQQQEGFVPEYLAKGLTIPVGQEEGGTKRFLSSLGLPFEDVTQMLNPRGVKQTAEQALSNLNPLIKGPLEYATGQQFYSGRQQADLSSQGLTGNPLVDSVLMNSPASRALTSARTLMDERKGPLAKAVNLGTGLRLTDVDMNKQRVLAERDLLNQALQQEGGIKKYQSFYAKPEDMANLSPEAVLLMRLQATMDAEARLRKKAG